MLTSLNHLLKAALSLVVLAVLGTGAWVAWRAFYADELAQQRIAQQLRQLEEKDAQLAALRDELQAGQEQIAQQQADMDRLRIDLQQKEQEIARLDAALRFLKVTRRVARLEVLDQQRRADGRLYTTLRFVEVDPDSPDQRALDQPRQFELEGDVVYVDAWVAKFDDALVERGDDPLRSGSICLFRRLFGESQQPRDGFPLDPVGQRPAAYGRGEPSPLERELWANFWEYANDPAKMKAAGLRAVHGEAPSQRVQKGKQYRLQLRASGGLEFGPPEDLPLAAQRAG